MATATTPARFALVVVLVTSCAAGHVIDDELEHARTTQEKDCTTTKEFDIVVRSGDRELRTIHLMDASCSGPEALYMLARE
jgi:hypothetical protein